MFIKVPLKKEKRILFFTLIANCVKIHILAKIINQFIQTQILKVFVTSKAS